MDGPSGRFFRGPGDKAMSERLDASESDVLFVALLVGFFLVRRVAMVSPVRKVSFSRRG